jgi:aconitase B
LATITTDDLDRKVEDKKKEIKNLQLKLNTILSKSDKNLDILRAQSNYDLLILQKETQPSEQILDIQTKKSNIQDIEMQIKDKEKDLREAKNDYAELLS